MRGRETTNAPGFFGRCSKTGVGKTGVNWKCGQEISLRLMAWCFALYAFLESPETTRERLALFVRAVFESARRVRANINYALSQKNNHGVSECVGLICAGTLFPEFRGSAEWLSCGVKNLERQIRELVYPDGGFSQHSLNYHRVMMQDLTFALRISEVNGVELPGILRERLLLAADYARDFVFGNDGDTPCWGANDGAHVFRLSECVYRDFRPHLQCANIGFRRARAFPEGSWDEEALWFFGKPALEAVDKEVSPLRKRFSASVAGTQSSFDAGLPHTARGTTTFCTWTFGETGHASSAIPARSATILPCRSPRNITSCRQTGSRRWSA